MHPQTALEVNMCRDNDQYQVVIGYHCYQIREIQRLVQAQDLRAHGLFARL